MPFVRPADHWRHLALLVALLLLMIVVPIVSQFRYGIVVMLIVGVGVLSAGTYAISPRKDLFAVTLVLTGIAIVMSAFMFIAPAKWPALATQASTLAVLALFTVSILAYVFDRSPVTADKIYAAICVYLLIGYAWAFVYAILEACSPGAFSIAKDATAPNEFIGYVMQLRYFSFATLTTVGYGDIVARSPTARTFAILEAITGQIYLTVLVARLVGLHIVHAHVQHRQSDLRD